MTVSLVLAKPECQALPKPRLFSIRFMENRRRKRFLTYFNEGPLRGSREALIRKTGLTKGRVSQLFDESQPFGERAARSLAEKLGLQSDAFEADASDTKAWFVALSPGSHGEEPSHIAPSELKRLMDDLRDLLPEERDDYLEKIHARAEQMRRYKEAFLQERGIPPPVSDHHVARHIKPAPRWSGTERRIEDIGNIPERRSREFKR